MLFIINFAAHIDYVSYDILYCSRPYMAHAVYTGPYSQLRRVEYGIALHIKKVSILLFVMIVAHVTK